MIDRFQFKRTCWLWSGEVSYLLTLQESFQEELKRAVFQPHYGQASVMTSQDPDFYTRKQIEPNVRIPGIKVGSKGMLGMRLETSEVFVEWFGLNSLCTKNKNKTKQVKKYLGKKSLNWELMR